MHRFSRWKVRLSEARTVAQVIMLMGAYLNTVRAADLERLPASCWGALTPDDIPTSAVILVREELKFSGDFEVAAMLHEIAHTFVAASTRIASLQAQVQPAGIRDEQQSTVH